MAFFPRLSILGLFLPTLLLALSANASAQLPGCGFRVEDNTSCWRETKSGPTSVPSCAVADRSSDPWALSSQLTGASYDAYPRWDLPEVIAAGNLRYGWGDPRPAGYWPLGGPVNEPWAESLPTLIDNLRWACDHHSELPADLQFLMGSPDEYDMIFHEAELFDLLFLGGARRLGDRIKEVRGLGLPGGPEGEEEPVEEPPCQKGPETLCLSQGRFRLSAEWVNHQGQTGTGKAVEISDNTGTFWFFQAANVEVVVKVLNGCPNNGHFWVFAGGLTNVEVHLTVEDTKTGDRKIYTNVGGEAFQPIQDVKAFPTCR
jgi:hypothetical protein